MPPKVVPVRLLRVRIIKVSVCMFQMIQLHFQKIFLRFVHLPEKLPGWTSASLTAVTSVSEK